MKLFQLAKLDVGFETGAGMSSKAATVLVVDDDEGVRNVIARHLGQAGYRVTKAADGEEAIKVSLARPFDAVLLDLRMPGMGGHRALEKLLAIEPETAVLIVSAVDEVSDAVQAMRSGAADYIQKPVDFNELQMAVERALRLRSRRRQRGYISSVAALAAALEAKDPYTQGHSERVTVYALRLAQQIGIDAELMDDIQAAGPLHDIGKIGIREEVLHKPGKLDDEEFEHIKMHPRIGSRMLAHQDSLSRIHQLVRHHHERIDGRGYPDGLAGEEIPLGARILAVADTFDAMTSNRPYRKFLDDEEARRRLIDAGGSQLDNELVPVFVDLLDRGWLPGRPAGAGHPTQEMPRVEPAEGEAVEEKDEDG